MEMTLPSCWILHDGRIGNIVQCEGLAAALGLSPVLKTVELAFPWNKLPTKICPKSLSTISKESSSLVGEFPDLIIACGRQTVPITLAIKKATGGKTAAIYIHEPYVSPALFDAVIVSEHDRVRGTNVAALKGSLNALSEAALDSARQTYQSRFSSLQRPLIGVLVGGGNGAYKVTSEAIDDLVRKLAQLCLESGAGLAVTTSRRSGAELEAKLAAAIADKNLDADVWYAGAPEPGDNPYKGILALADSFVVTSDSVNMACEPAFTGKPVQVFHWPGGRKKFFDFHASFERAGITKKFEGKLPTWGYEPLRETERAADFVKEQLKGRFTFA
jgi:uncharacterized protein